MEEAAVGGTDGLDEGERQGDLVSGRGEHVVPEGDGEHVVGGSVGVKAVEV